MGRRKRIFTIYVGGQHCRPDLCRRFRRARGKQDDTSFLQDYADFLESHIESWTVTTDGSLVPGIKRHYIRIHPAAIDDASPDEDPNHGLLTIHNRPPGLLWQFPAKDITDGGFLELVRYGVRKPGDPLVEDSLRVVDELDVRKIVMEQKTYRTFHFENTVACKSAFTG